MLHAARVAMPPLVQSEADAMWGTIVAFLHSARPSFVRKEKETERDESDPRSQPEIWGGGWDGNGMRLTRLHEGLVLEDVEAAPEVGVGLEVRHECDLVHHGREITMFKTPGTFSLTPRKRSPCASWRKRRPPCRGTPLSLT